MFDPYFKRRMKAAAIRERRMGAVDFSLPVDGDALETRKPLAAAGSFMDSILADLVKEKTPFFDEICARWKELFPDLRARPGKWVAAASGNGGKVFIYVSSAAALFALRPKLPSIRKKLAELSTAPSRFTVHLEAHMV
jgi:hypothetical protein